MYVGLVAGEEIGDVGERDRRDVDAVESILDLAVERAHLEVRQTVADDEHNLIGEIGSQRLDVYISGLDTELAVEV